MANNQLPPCTFSAMERFQWWAFTPEIRHPLQDFGLEMGVGVCPRVVLSGCIHTWKECLAWMGRVGRVHFLRYVYTSHARSCSSGTETSYSGLQSPDCCGAFISRTSDLWHWCVALETRQAVLGSSGSHIYTHARARTRAHARTCVQA